MAMRSISKINKQTNKKAHLSTLGDFHENLHWTLYMQNANPLNLKSLSSLSH